jgi:DNA replication protein DnaC
MFEDIIKKQFDKEDKNILNTLLYKTDLLIIDNLGNESGRNENQFAQRTLEMILRKRDNASLPTIVSTNYNLDEVGSEYNKDIKDFLTQNNICVYFSGDNYRVKKEIRALADEDDFEF